MVDQLGRGLKDLRISLIDACGFRCSYCMPASGTYHFLKAKDLMSLEEMRLFVELFASLGVTKVRLTGGEPLLRPGLAEIIRSLKKITSITDIALTTNGERLPDLARELKSAGLSRLTVSCDAITPEVFNRITGTKSGTERLVMEGVAEALRVGFSPIKINAVIQKGVNEGEIEKLLKAFSGPQFHLRFIEYMDVGNQNAWKLRDVFSATEIFERITQIEPLLALPALVNGEVAKRYRREGGGEVGLITSVSKPFCSTCYRARLSANGHFYTCLFASKGVDLLTPLRLGATPQELLDLIKQTWTSRQDRYSELRQTHSEASKGSKKVEMFHVGG